MVLQEKNRFEATALQREGSGIVTLSLRVMESGKQPHYAPYVQYTMCEDMTSAILRAGPARTWRGSNEPGIGIAHGGGILSW